MKIRHETPNPRPSKKTSLSVQDGFVYHEKTGDSSPYSAYMGETSKSKLKKSSPESQRRYESSIDHMVIEE